MGDIRGDYLKALDLYYQTTNALKGMQFLADRAECLSGYLFKLFAHASTAYTISLGTKVPNMSTDVFFWDNATLTALVREALETYCGLHYIFVDPNDDDQLEYRVCYLRLRGLKTREN